MDVHAKTVYALACGYIKTKYPNMIVDHNILEYACRYHNCCSKLDKMSKHKHLMNMFDKTKSAIILNLIDCMCDNKKETWPEYKMYVNALRYGEDPSIEDLSKNTVVMVGSGMSSQSVLTSGTPLS